MDAHVPILRFSIVRAALLLALCAMGLNSCETAQHRMEREIAAAIPSFNAPERYQAYRNLHGEKARRLREASAKAAGMRLHITSVNGKQQSAFLPLAEAERRAVRELLAQIEETPCLEYPMWLEEEYEQAVTGPWPSPPLYWTSLEFLSAGGKVLHSFDGFDRTIGDSDQAETYRTARYRPEFMLPPAAQAQWNKLPCLLRCKQKLRELYEQE